MKKKALG